MDLVAHGILHVETTKSKLLGPRFALSQNAACAELLEGLAGNRNCWLFRYGLQGSGSLAMFAAIRRASSD
jgi:hypothetical protein